MAKIFESVFVDWGGREVFDDGLTGFSGAAYLSEKYAPEGQNRLDFNYYIPADGQGFIEWHEPLPANVALAAETLEAAAICCIGREIVDEIRADRLAA